VAYPVGVYVTHVATADMNHDGRADLVMVGLFDQTLRVMLNTGGRTFAPRAPITKNPS
jgi:hypothetical protein